MATQHSRSAARFMMAPAVILLLGWMLVPLVMTLWFSFRRFLPNRPDIVPGWVGFDNYVRFVTSSSFWPSVQTTLIIVGGALLITIAFGRAPGAASGSADVGPGRRPYPGDRSVLRDANGVCPGLEEHVHGPGQRLVFPSLARLRCRSRGLAQRRMPLFSIILIVSWQWLPFATLILLTAIQSLDSEQLEASEMDGAPPLSRFFHIILPHLSRAITIVILIQIIFLLSIFRRDFRHHRGRLRHPHADLSDLPARAGKPECRARQRRRCLRYHSGQHRCHLPDAHCRQEPGRVRR
jgi:sorbitol/mannitol transport system permease protein